MRGSVAQPRAVGRPGSLTLALARPWLQTLLAGVGYLAFAVYLTWPLAVDLDTRIYGAIGDMTGAMSLFREYVESGRPPFLPGTLSDLSAPEGLPVSWTLNIASWPSVLTLYALTATLGEMMAFGVYTLLGFTLSGLAMFLFVRRYVGHAGVALVAGWAYAFFPLPVVKAQGHVDFVHGWVLVVVLWRLVELIRRPDRRNGLLAGLAVVFAMAWTPYHVLFAGVGAAALGVVGLVAARREGRLGPMLGALGIVGALVVTWVAGMLLLNLAAPTSELRVRSLTEAYVYGARWHEYLVPTPSHPLVGDWAGEFRSRDLHGSNFAETTLYVGVSVLLLALVGLVAARRGSREARVLALGALAVCIAGLLFSAPPKISPLGIQIPMPTLVVFEVTSAWRVFSRMALLVMLGLVVLAALGLLALVRGRSRVVQALVVVAALGIVAGDLWSRQPVGTNKIGVPDEYLRLAQLPPGIAAEYPLVPAANSNYGDIFYQGWHDQPLLNGYRGGSPSEARALRLTQLDEPDTARGLSALGVRYVMARRDPTAVGLPDPGRPGRGFRLLYEGPYLSVYRVSVAGPAVLASPVEGFHAAEQGPEGRYQWLDGREGTLELRGSCRPCAGRLRLHLTSFARPREVRVRDAAGRLLLRRKVARGVVEVPVRFAGRTTLRLGVTPGAQAVPGPDPRSVAVAVGRVSFVPDPRRS